MKRSIHTLFFSTLSLFALLCSPVTAADKPTASPPAASATKTNQQHRGDTLSIKDLESSLIGDAYHLNFLENTPGAIVLSGKSAKGDYMHFTIRPTAEDHKLITDIGLQKCIGKVSIESGKITFTISSEGKKVTMFDQTAIHYAARTDHSGLTADATGATGKAKPRS